MTFGSGRDSVFTDDDMDHLRVTYGIPDSVEIHAPKKHKRVDWTIPGWTCFYEYFLRQGFRFPMLSLACRLLVFYDIDLS